MNKRTHRKKADHRAGINRNRSCSREKDRRSGRRNGENTAIKNFALIVVLILFFVLGIITILSVFFGVGSLNPEQRQVFANVILIGVASAFFGLLTRGKQ